MQAIMLNIGNKLVKFFDANNTLSARATLEALGSDVLIDN